MSVNASHLPSNFDPTQYVVVDAFDNQPPPGSFLPVPGTQELNPYHKAHLHARDLLDKSVTSAYDKDDRGWQCDHCGAHIRYVNVVLHVPTGNHIAMGNTCVERLNIENRAAFRLQFIKDHAGRAALHAKKIERRGQFLSGLAEPIRTDLIKALECPHQIVQDIAGKLLEFGSISERQVAFVLKLARDYKTPEQKAAEQAQQNAGLQPAPEGVITLTGTVVSTRRVENNFGYKSNSTLKGLIVASAPSPFKIWVTIPASLSGVVKGDVVRLTCTVKRSPNDPLFSFGSRPRNGSYVSSGTPAVEESTSVEAAQAVRESQPASELESVLF